MSMFVGPSKSEVLEMLREETASVPLTLGHGQPQAIIDLDEDSWVVKPLILNGKAARKAASEARAAGRPWMPEMEMQFLEPGVPMIRAESAPALADKLERMNWSWG